MPFRILPLVTLATLISAPPPESRTTQDLSGYYLCEGIGADNESYRGVVQIARHRETYQVRWAIPPRDAYRGFGILKGDTLAVSYYGAVVGLAVYTIGEGGTLTGTWTVGGGDGQVYLEKLTKMKGEVSGPIEMPRPEAPRPQRRRTLPATAVM